MNARLEKKLRLLPKEPGVYFHKDSAGTIIYIGKAAVLRNRVRQYFQASRGRDPKTEALVREITDVDWMVVDSEMEALFLEAEMIRRYLPRDRILLRDDKSLSYIRIDYNSDYPTVTTTRRPLDDGARYFGPYSSTSAVRQALKLLRRIFPFATKRVVGQKRANLYYHLGLDPGLEERKTSLKTYKANLRRVMAIIQGKRIAIMKEIERDMKRAAKCKDYETAAHLRNQLFALQNLHRQVIFSDKEFLDISKDHALSELVNLLGLKVFPRRVEGYDISHMQGSDVVASMVVFSNGVSDKAEYRKFKTRYDQNNDFYNMQETLSRRLSERNVKKWGLPDLILIDGGKGQLDAALKARDAAGHNQLPCIGLAKREEQIIASVERSQVAINQTVLHDLGGFMTTSETYLIINVPHSTNLIKLLQRIRDESHRFAVSYHSVLKIKRQTSSYLDDIPGVGPATRKKLLQTFGSLAAVSQAPLKDLQSAVGIKKARVLKQYLSR
jgi:excinuclease ABC subunit C